MSQSSETTNLNRFEALGFENFKSTLSYYAAQVHGEVGVVIHTYTSLLAVRQNAKPEIIVQFFHIEGEGDDILNTYISSIMKRVTTNAPPARPEYLKTSFQVPGDTDLLTLKALIFEAADKILEHQYAAHSPK